MPNQRKDLILSKKLKMKRKKEADEHEQTGDPLYLRMRLNLSMRNSLKMLKELWKRKISTTIKTQYWSFIM
jgi:hypothetical protein